MPFNRTPHSCLVYCKAQVLHNGINKEKINGSNYYFPTTMVNAVKNCRKAGIHGNCTWIMAYPGEELKHLQTSVAFIMWQKEFWTEGIEPGTKEYKSLEDGVNQKMFTATAYPGTEMRNAVKPELTRHFDIEYDKYGEPICDDNFHNYVL